MIGCLEIDKAKLAHHIEGLQEELSNRDSQILVLDSRFSQRNTQIIELQEELSRKNAEIIKLEKEVRIILLLIFFLYLQTFLNVCLMNSHIAGLSICNFVWRF